MYEVAWTLAAKAELRAIFQTTEDPVQLVESLTTLQYELKVRPLQAGFAREASVHRMHFVRPLLIEYEVIEDDKRVVVLGLLEHHGN